MKPTDSISLRPIVPEDRPFLLEVYAGIRREELAVVPWDDSQKNAFLTMQFDLQDRYYRQQFPGASFDVILLGGRRIGRLYIDRRVDEIRIIDIALRREDRGVGIGGAILADLIDEAERSNKPIRLHVDRANRALDLYRRLGFAKIGESAIHDLMEWAP